MLIYKQRYKPRTTREFTKSDLTVYDSAGNTALNALTVYGKSKVVDGAIVSAGKGWATVDMGTLTWTYWSAKNCFSTADLSSNQKIITADQLSPYLCAKYTVTAPYIYGLWQDSPNKSIFQSISEGFVVIHDTTYTDAASFKTAMSGVILAYQLADPTQGNCIAIKTDNGTGVDGTMSVFTTGTPQRGIPDTDVRDFMAWDGSAGTVTKKCDEVDLGTLTWSYVSDDVFFTSSLYGLKKPGRHNYINTVYGFSDLPFANMPDKTMKGNSDAGGLYVKDTAFGQNPVTAKTGLSGVLVVYELATPTTAPLTSTENANIAGLRTFEPTTHAQNNAGAEMKVDYTIRVPTI